ncbi:DUF2071 domain-containing protein [Bacillus sp. DNRA2]|uniref:YqjF family protein n=1 Tax=Bacillus sp. DNRA2 TaxID=2723053 RepID=UPI00145F6ABB|nr:DUF2071 domain-containing protein [Bacillus sp. DNRA2]NMD69298.1 DUF2071 domain-containing protein [Bacillus sp. DNRA2]
MDLMNDMSHRPWPIPSKNWIMRQTWSHLIFAHYPIPAELLRPYIPSSLIIDTYNGTAWLSIVAFQMEGIYFRGLRGLSVTPKFPEINVRTYVQFNGKPGVYFLSLDVGDWASLIIASRWYHLPYQPAQVSFIKEKQSFKVRSSRRGTLKHPIEFYGAFEPLSDVYFPEKETLDHWATERYCLFSTDKRANLYCGEIHHIAWPIQKVKTEITKNSLFTPFQLQPSESEPIVHYAKGLDTLFWNIKRL